MNSKKNSCYGNYMRKYGNLQMATFEFFRYIQFWIYPATFGFSNAEWFSMEYKVKRSIQNNREKFTYPIAKT